MLELQESSQSTAPTIVVLPEIVGLNRAVVGADHLNGESVIVLTGQIPVSHLVGWWASI